MLSHYQRSDTPAITLEEPSADTTVTVIVPMEQLHWEHRQTIMALVKTGFNYPLLINYLLRTAMDEQPMHDGVWAKVYKSDNGDFTITPEMTALATAITDYFAAVLRNPSFRELLITKGLAVDQATIKRYLASEQAIVVEFHCLRA